MHNDFDTNWIAEFLVTTVARVDRLADRSEITRSGKKVGKRNRFSFQDVCRLDLAYALFRGGLRGPAIRSILKCEQVGRLIGHLRGLEGIRQRAKTAGFLLAGGFSTAKKQTFGFFRRVPNVGKNLSAPESRMCVVIPLNLWLRGLAKRMEDFTSL